MTTKYILQGNCRDTSAALHVRCQPSTAKPLFHEHALGRSRGRVATSKRWTARRRSSRQVRSCVPVSCHRYSFILWRALSAGNAPDTGLDDPPCVMQVPEGAKPDLQGRVWHFWHPRSLKLERDLVTDPCPLPLPKWYGRDGWLAGANPPSPAAVRLRSTS